MPIRLRAIITRIQTMRTSTIVSIGILIGLLLVFYLKESEYRKRVAMTARLSDTSKKLAFTRRDEATDTEFIKHIKEAFLVNNLNTNYENTQSVSKETTTSPTLGFSSTTTGFNDTENILKQKINSEKEQKNNTENSIEKTGRTGDENNANKQTAVTKSVDPTNTNVNDTSIIKYDDAATSDEAPKTLRYPKTEGKELDAKKEEQGVQMMADAKSEILAQEANALLIKVAQNQNEMPENVKKEQQNIEMELKPNLNDLLNKDNNVNLSKGPIVTPSNVYIESPHDNMKMNSDKMQEEISDSSDTVKEQIQMLVRKYSGTLNEKDLPRQNDTYTQRLRNKLVQTGRFDLMVNEKCRKRLPKCLIIGVMKAGTEAFSTFLGVHPQVAMQFGYAAMAFFSSSEFENGYEWYRERMMCSTKDQVTMEKSPQYFSSSLAPKRIYDMDPDMKLIVLIRNPISRALSHFLQQESSHPERLSAPTFEECVFNKETNKVIESSPYVRQSTYSTILKYWLQFFPYKQLLIIDGDTFKKNPTRSLSKTESFLGIDHSISRDRLYFNQEKGFYCLKINSTVQEDLDMSCFGSEKGRTHPEIDPLVENALKKYFKPFNDEFMEMTHMRMNW